MALPSFNRTTGIKSCLRMRPRVVLEFLVLLIVSCTSAAVVPARFWALSEPEKNIYLGLAALDSTCALKYLGCDTPAERATFLNEKWSSPVESIAALQRRVSSAATTFGKYSTVTDDRAKLWVRYGAPTERKIVEARKKRISFTAFRDAQPVEVWTYAGRGEEFDFVRPSIGTGYTVIAASRFGEKASVAWLTATGPADAVAGRTDLRTPAFDVSFGRFRQKKGVTRLEVYSCLELGDTAGVVLKRDIDVLESDGTKVDSISELLVPRGRGYGYFIDQASMLLAPKAYRVVFSLAALPTGVRVTKTLNVEMLEYAEDLKMVSDLVRASLIDPCSISPKFEKPGLGRVIPMVRNTTEAYQPFCLYHEVYNLMLDEKGNHRAKTTYRIFEVTGLEEQTVDFVEYIDENAGAIAYFGVKYHPMDLPPGKYVIVAETVDLVSGRNTSTSCTFELQ